MEKDSFKEFINKDFQQEVPSFDFTQDVMQKIELASENKTLIEPLIPKKAWWIIGAFYSFLLLFPFLISMQENTILFLEQINFGGFDYQHIKENLQLIFNIIFVFAALTLGDILLKSRKWA
ncbi:MAG: hypothetical protein JKY48_17325 [Flavobacteriales bacterium]|nr:hypothetical protein [Flavobacteriales bacterium]